MLNSRKRWSIREDNCLKDNLAKGTSHREIAKLLQRSISSIDNRIIILNLAKVEKKWSEKETQFLRDNYRKMKAKEIAKALNRTTHMIQSKARNIGLNKKISESQRHRVIDMAKETIFTSEQIAHEANMSRSMVQKILRQNAIKRKVGLKPTFSALKGFHYNGKGHHSKLRYELLYAYHNTCWDCKKTFVNEADLHIHHDLTQLPVRVYILCIKCHGKRHNRNFKFGTFQHS